MKWKLVRQTFGTEEFTISEGEEVTIGRAMNNTITLSSIVISRNHCVINVQKNGTISITDLKSSNGVYVGLKKIPQNSPFIISDLDIIGIGWTIGAPLANINDSEKFVFKLIKQENTLSVMNRLQFQNEHDIEENLASLDLKPGPSSPVLDSKLSLKRKHNDIQIKKEKKHKSDDEVINLLSDSETEDKRHVDIKEIKLESIIEEVTGPSYKNQIKMESDDYLQYEAFNVKQEYLGYEDDEPVNVDSDSESDHWYMRLSQSSPGKPFTKISLEPEEKQDESSYSQMDDFAPDMGFNDEEEDEEEFMDDLIILPDIPEVGLDVDKEYNIVSSMPPADDMGKDTVDGCSTEPPVIQAEKKKEEVTPDVLNDGKQKKTQMIEPLVHRNRVKTKHSETETKKKSSRHSKIKKHSSHKHISNSQKEERKRKLKELASKDKETDDSTKETSNSSLKSTTNIKVTTKNRGDFLTNAVNVVKPVRRKEEPKEKSKKEPVTSPKQSKSKTKSQSSLSSDNIENKEEKVQKVHETKEKQNKSITKTREGAPRDPKLQESRVPLKSLKPLTGSVESTSDKPCSVVEPLPLKKTVRFSDKPPEVHEFIIEPGNKMKRTSLVKTNLLDTRQMPIFSLEKITLMKILRWNPHWLNEQENNPDPPPILGHNKSPMAVFHSFENHHQYVQLIGDLLLMEIWECLTLGHKRIKNQNIGIQMRIGSLPPFPAQEYSYELFSFNVDVSMPSHETKCMPRAGEIIVATFGLENMKNSRFFYVHNVKCLPAPPNNRNSFFCISLHSTYTEKMRSLKIGEVIIGTPLAYINKELNLFEAMEYLAFSPLSEVILKPDSRHFQRQNMNFDAEMKSEWNINLNPSQQLAVASSVGAALGDKPSIQMVVGPPGTGKSSVICAIVMTYFYDEHRKRKQNRGKILICATSNAAVDELVIRLLNIRQNLPKTERFRMVRVGRAEAMHARARDVSSQQLAHRDFAAQRAAPDTAGLAQEIAHLEARINMWRTAAQDAKDPVRVAYCQTRVEEATKRINLLRSGAGGGSGEDLRPDQLIGAEKRIIEGADIIVTTLSSAQNYKMKGLKRRIALCIVDEAGQAIEPEVLIPLTLDVTRVTLIGDPQQLPGYICSQRAKKHGLGESLFSRLSAGGAGVLLDRQYRMQPAIADYPTRTFYDGRVRHQPPPRPPLPLPPYALLTVSSGDLGQGISGANDIEACGVSRLVVALASILRPRSLSLAVITPYNAHKDLIKRYVKMLQDPNAAAVEVNTVDSFQGQERDVVVVSLARSHGVGFLADAGRMNVMLTRARHALLLCLNPHAMLNNQLWQTLVDDAMRRNMCKILPKEFCVPISAGRAYTNEILRFLSD